MVVWPIDVYKRQIIGIRNAADIFKYNFWRTGSQCFRGREVVKEWWSNHIHTLVCALRRQDDGDQQFERIVVMQFQMCIRDRYTPAATRIVNFSLSLGMSASEALGLTINSLFQLQ